MGKNQDYELRPIYLIKDRMAGKIPQELKDLGLRVSLTKIIPDTQKFAIGFQSAPRDYVVLKAIEKPFINILWIGTLILTFGFGVAIYRRYTEFRKMRDKKIE